MLGRMSDHATAQRKSLLLYGATAFSKILSRIVGAAAIFKASESSQAHLEAQSRATRAPAAPKFPKTLAENIASS